MKDRTKEIVRDGFASLVNNAACIRGGKNGPLWLTIVMFFLSLFLPVIPVFVTQAQSQGSSFIKSNWYGMENYVTGLATQLKNDNVKLTITDDHNLKITKAGADIEYTTYDYEVDGTDKNGNAIKIRTVAPFDGYINEVTGQYDLVIYVSNAVTKKGRSDVESNISSKKFVIGTTNAPASDDETNVYNPSFILLYPNAFRVGIFASNGTKLVTGSSLGDYKTMQVGSEAISYLLDVKDKEGNVITASRTNPAYTSGVINNFKKVLNKSYETSKVRTMWGTSGIYLGIFAGLNILMGFLMWILTRGKNNPNNYYSPWLTMKIQGRLGLAPALIATVAGFFLPGYIYIIYILLVGLRVMWMSMKELRPVQQ